MPRGLNRDAILDAAFAVLDAVGADGLTTRAVADRLGVKAPALYWHIRDKQALLDEMGTRVWASVIRSSVVGGQLPDPSSERTPDEPAWWSACAAFARTARSALLAHRDGARLFAGTALTDSQVLTDQERGLEWMGAQGFSVAATADAFTILIAFVVGQCIEEQGRTQAPAGTYDLAARDERIGADDHPLVAAAGRRLFDPDVDRRFEDLLQLVLTGIAALGER
ncbi:TetR family transcriptional regulator [Nakamurella flava]|jgi:TetR/AcrR family tetracycline transcriptional repressor|uniref:TetR family transcriptional regulator n=1 Tax=Nakamurella flava TaxID=2576308 RepID=A0A4U6QJF2_9ACTN|nr:TetR/AcrR family transcriptional regulator C-terminal domain-containing protein [Nakamurella flava]TKV60597.1 TetR family transcriptional regulator [Nakamurella flava]